MENNKEAKIEMQKEFPVSKDKLYQAWISPEELKKWWKPMDSSLINVVNDVKNGGEIKYEFSKSDGGNTFHVTGKYEEVIDLEKLVYSWDWKMEEATLEDGNFRLTILFKDQNEKSMISILQENFSNPDAVAPHRAGWEKGLNDLYKYLTSTQGEINKSGNHQTTDSMPEEGKPGVNNNEEIDGYNELKEQEKVGGYN